MEKSDRDRLHEQQEPIVEKEESQVELQEAIEVGPTPEELAELRRKAEESDALLDKLKRATADYINSQKRIEREMQERSKFAIESFAKDLLVVADDLSRAVASARDLGTSEELVSGLLLVEQHLLTALRRHGVIPIETKQGDPFNPEIHEAVSTLEAEDFPPSSVVQELAKGFRIHQRVLRPSRVVVSMPPGTAPEGEDKE